MKNLTFSQGVQAVINQLECDRGIRAIEMRYEDMLNHKEEHSNDYCKGYDKGLYIVRLTETSQKKRNN